MIKTLYMRGCRKLAHWRGDRRQEVRWTNLIRTQQVLPRMRERFDVTIPPSIHLEINTDCNYKCPFCPQSSAQRPVRYMTRQGFGRFLDELKGLHFSGWLALSVNNEPFLHPLVVEFCRRISEELPGVTTCLISNGALIREDDVLALGRLAHPPRITIDDYTPDHRIIQRLTPWFALPEAAGIAVDMKKRSWNETISNRAGNQPGCTTDPADYTDVTCAWPFNGLFLTAELKAFLCCADYNHDMIVGDLNTQGLMEIWAGEPLRRIREAMLIPNRARVPLCGRCDTEWFNLPAHCD